MHQDLAIWCPVVITSLAAPRTFRHNSHYQMTDNYRRIEDMKVRIKSIQSQAQGKYVETKVGVSCLCLLENEQGRPCSIKREEVLVDRVPLRNFNPLADGQQELFYIHDICNFSWDAELNGNTIHISFELSYKLMGTKKQMVFVSASLKQAEATINAKTDLPQEFKPIHTSAEENLRLRRQVHFYETNLTSLKRAVQKAEKDNSALNIELKNYKDRVEELQVAINEKERIIHGYTNHCPRENANTKPRSPEFNKLTHRFKSILSHIL